MTKLRLFLWVTILVASSVILMHLLYLKNYNVKDTAIHIVTSLNFHSPEKSPEKDKETIKIDPHGHIPLKGDDKVEEVPPEIVTKAPKPVEKQNTEPEKPKATEPQKIVTTEKKVPAEKKEEIKKADPTKKEDKIEKNENEKKPVPNNGNLCPVKGKALGPLAIDQRVPEMEALNKEFSDVNGGWVAKGGRWKPTECVARRKVALILPYRKREPQLKIFLKHLHPILHRQQLHYQIFVVEQSGDDPFNRAGLFNIGFTEALKVDDFDCFVFSDVDLLPEDDRNSYGCPSSPRHMSVAIDKFNYRLPYESIFGGVGAFSRKDFETVNGFSNMFWGWGGEDDDLYQRIRAKSFRLTRPSMTVGRYTMVRIHHFQSHGADPNRRHLMHMTEWRMKHDGLNSLKYELNECIELPLATILNVKLSLSMYGAFMHYFAVYVAMIKRDKRHRISHEDLSNLGFSFGFAF